MKPSKIYYSFIAIAVAMLSLLAACDNSVSPEKSWQQAVNLDTARAYNEFLQRFPNHPRAPEAQRALRETVLIPYLGYVGSDADRPPLDKLVVPAQVLASPASMIFDNADTSTKGSFTAISINGHSFKLTTPEYNGKEIQTEKFGKLRCVLAQQGFGDKSQTMILYLGGIRSQRDKIIAQVSSAAK